MAFIAKSSIQEVEDKMDAAAVVGDYVRLTAQSGGRYIGLCPFHNEKTPSFSVNTDRKLYYCFGCHKGGTVVNFLMEMDKLTFPEAIETLARRFGVALAYENSGGTPADDERIKRNEELFELYRRTAGTFHHFLTKNAEGRPTRDYLVSRGISTEMVETFRLGYAPQDRYWLHRFLMQKGYSPPFLASSGLFSPQYPEVSFFSGRLIFPISDRQGRTVAFGGRILPASEGDSPPEDTGKWKGPKYINSRESEFYKKGQTLFAVDLAQAEIRKKREVYLAEGYMDVIALHQAGMANAVAPLGTAFTDEQARLLRRWAERVYLFLDTDEAGQNAAIKAILTCRRNGLTAGVILPPQRHPEEAVAKDPAEILQKFGPEALQNCVKTVILDFDYLLSRSKAGFDFSGSEGKAKAAAFLFPFAQTLDSEVARETCLASVADALAVDRGAVLQDYRRFAANRENGWSTAPGEMGEKKRKEDISQGTKPVRQNDELSLLAAVSVNQNLYPRFRVALEIRDIEDPAAKELFIALEECFVHDESGLDDLLSRISREDLRNFVIERGSSREFSVNPEQLVADGIKKVRRKQLERRLKSIDIYLQSRSGQPENEENLLLVEKMEIRAELRRLKEDSP